jgi:proteic killer suppression protein
MSQEGVVITNFRDTGAVVNSESPEGLPTDLVKLARRKLRYLKAADNLRDLRSPSGNRLEALAGDRKGRHSIRINDQQSVEASDTMRHAGSNLSTAP